jgi:hypothetical protein
MCWFADWVTLLSARCKYKKTYILFLLWCDEVYELLLPGLAQLTVHFTRNMLTFVESAALLYKTNRD